MKLVAFEGLDHPITFLDGTERLLDHLDTIVHDWPWWNITGHSADSLVSVRRENGLYRIDAPWLDEPIRETVELRAAGNLVVTRPNLGHIRGDLLATSFRYAEDQLSLADGEFRFGESRLLIAGNGRIGDQPDFQARIVAEQGRVQDVLRLMRWFELSDLARGIAPPTLGQASDVTVAPVGEPHNPLLDQLRRYAEILALQTIEATQAREAERLMDMLHQLAHQAARR